MSDEENLQNALSNAVDNLHDKNTNEKTDSVAVEDVRDDKLWRDLTAYWVLGLCNNYGYVVMLCAAQDIIERFGEHQTTLKESTIDLPGEGRNCSIMSTGVLLLADTLPSMSVKLIAPFLPFLIRVRMTVACILSALGFIVVANAQVEWHAIFGIILTSFSCGLGETSLLAYTSKFSKNVISTWSSGTGASGVAGSFTYAALIALGLTPKKSLIIMLIVPTVQALAFFTLLRNPNRTHGSVASDSSASDDVLESSETAALISTNNNDNNVRAETLLTVRQKFNYISELLKYILPLFTVYVCEYFINQGLYELIYFPNIWLDHAAQYRWLQVDYQIGVFLSRSSVNLFAIKNIWLMSVLQFVNIFYFSFEAVYYFTPTIWIVFAIVFWEGLLGGCVYVNTFYRMVNEVPDQYKNFALGVVPIGESFGVVLAGLLAIPAHNVICKMPLPV